MISFIGKGNKERTLRLSRAVLDNAIEPGVFGRRVTTAGAGLALKRYAKRAGITKNVSPHTLRHTFAVAQVTNGMPLNQLQAILGHASFRNDWSLSRSISGPRDGPDIGVKGGK
jgi:integrase/recombinase XerD